MSGLPALYDGHLVHVRRAPVRVFRNRITLWLVDLDAMPRLPLWMRPLARFPAADHFGAPDQPIRANVDDWLASRDIDLAGGQVVMLAAARTLGHAFNPLTVFWCHHADGSLVCVIAEVSNTYGERHCYLLPPAETAQVEKAFYVSPFLPMRGTYHMRLPVPGNLMSLSVSLRDGDRTLLTAVLTGNRRPATPAETLRTAWRRPLTPQRISALIRFHGVRLWISGLPRTPR